MVHPNNVLLDNLSWPKPTLCWQKIELHGIHKLTISWIQLRWMLLRWVHGFRTPTPHPHLNMQLRFAAAHPENPLVHMVPPLAIETSMDLLRRTFRGFAGSAMPLMSLSMKLWPSFSIEPWSIGLASLMDLIANCSLSQCWRNIRFSALSIDLVSPLGGSA